MSLQPIDNRLVLVLPVFTPWEWGTLPHSWWQVVTVNGNGGWECVIQFPSKVAAQAKARAIRRNIRRQMRERERNRRGPRGSRHKEVAG